MIRDLLNILLSPLREPIYRLAEKARREQLAKASVRRVEPFREPKADARDERMKQSPAQNPTPKRRQPPKSATSAQVQKPVVNEAMTPEKFLRQFGITAFYHFTDTRNLPSIKAHNGLLPWSEVKGSVVAPGGNDWSHDADAIKGQDDYIHLCFFAEHPMEFVAKRDGRIIESRFLRIDPSVIHRPGILFCSDVANKSGVEMLILEKAVKEMDFDIIARTNSQWLDSLQFQRKKRACKYELLVPGKIPLSLIAGI